MGPTAGLPASYRLARNLPFAMDSRVADVGVARVRPQAAPHDRPLTGGPEWAVPLLDFGETGLAVASTAMLRPPTAAPCVSARRALNHVRRVKRHPELTP